MDNDLSKLVQSLIQRSVDKLGEHRDPRDALRLLEVHSRNMGFKEEIIKGLTIDHLMNGTKAEHGGLSEFGEQVSRAIEVIDYSVTSGFVDATRSAAIRTSVKRKDWSQLHFQYNRRASTKCKCDVDSKCVSIANPRGLLSGCTKHVDLEYCVKWTNLSLELYKPQPLFSFEMTCCARHGLDEQVMCEAPIEEDDEGPDDHVSCDVCKLRGNLNLSIHRDSLIAFAEANKGTDGLFPDEMFLDEMSSDSDDDSSEEEDDDSNEEEDDDSSEEEDGDSGEDEGQSKLETKPETSNDADDSCDEKETEQSGMSICSSEEDMDPADIVMMSTLTLLISFPVYEDEFAVGFFIYSMVVPEYNDFDDGESSYQDDLE